MERQPGSRDPPDRRPDHGNRPRRIARNDHLIEQAKRELRSTGLLRHEPILAGHVVRLHRCYPVYRRGYREHVERLADYLRNFSGLTPIGRYGTFRYNNQDHSILMGILAAENLLDNRGHDLWSVNTDNETLQTGALITETGLGGSPAGQEAADQQLAAAGQT